MTAVLSLGLATLGVIVSASTTAAGSATSHDRTTSASPASSVLPQRWIAVPVGTLWVAPGSTRPVDRPTVSPPISVRTWIAMMSVAQKQWLVGRLETQALYGTKVLVTSTSSGWSRVLVTDQPTPRDPRGYPGWIPSWQLTSTRPPSADNVAVIRFASAWVQAAPDLKSADRIMEVSYGTRLAEVSASASFVRVALLGGRRGYVRRSDVTLRAAASTSRATDADVVTEARKFLGLSYLWGGTSGFGYDCSGLTYSVLHVLGVTIPRDAAPQATRGVPVARSRLRPGDLVFFRDASGTIQHVAIYEGAPGGVPSVIHAPGTGQGVRVTPLSSWPASSYAGARRYLSN